MAADLAHHVLRACTARGRVREGAGLTTVTVQTPAVCVITVMCVIMSIAQNGCTSRITAGVLRLCSLGNVMVSRPSKCDGASHSYSNGLLCGTHAELPVDVYVGRRALVRRIGIFVFVRISILAAATIPVPTSRAIHMGPSRTVARYWPYVCSSGPI